MWHIHIVKFVCSTIYNPLKKNPISTSISLQRLRSHYSESIISSEYEGDSN